MSHAGTDRVTIGKALHYGKWATPPPPGLPRDELAAWEWGAQESTDRHLSLMVSQDINRGLADRRAGLSRAVEELRTASVERLERLRSVAWTHALKGSAPHLREARLIEEQLARLQALNAPVRHEVDLGEASGVVESVTRELLGLLGKVAPAGPVLAPVREG